MEGRRISAAVSAGLAGGLVFGMMMHMMGMLPMIAMMAGSESAAVGWVIHLIISAVIGFGYGVVFHARRPPWLYGLIYGAIWWVLGPLLIMPAMLGIGLFMINGMTLLSLMGHLSYGLILGLVYGWLYARPAAA